MRTTPDENKAIARRFGEAINARHLDLLDAIVARDFVRHCQATPDVDVRNLDDFKTFLQADFTSFPDSVQSVTHLVAEGDLVAVWASYEGTQRGPMGPFPATGRRMQIDFGIFLRFEDRKIAEMWVTWDNAAALAQLGLLPPPGR